MLLIMCIVNTYNSTNVQQITNLQYNKNIERKYIEKQTKKQQKTIK